MINITYANVRFANQIKYTFNLILSTLGIDYEILNISEIKADTMISDFRSSLIISYGNEKPKLNSKHHIHIYQSELFGGNYMKPESMPKLPLKRYMDIPVIYEGNGNLRELVVRNENFIETNIDIIASSFFMLSRYEEYLVDERDQYDRFPASASIAYKEGFLTRPIVNEYIELLWQWIDSFNLCFDRKSLWNGKDFVACLTHDVDAVKKWDIRGIYHEFIQWNETSLKQRKPFAAICRMLKVIVSILNFENPYWNFDEIIALEERYGFLSSFYFFGGSHSGKYSVQDGKILNLMREMQNKGHEIGLHGSFNSYDNLEILRNEKANLEKLIGEIYSTRQHVLRFDVQKTLTIYEKLGIKCDVTLGYAQHEGFRTGFCLPFHPYNIEENRPFKVVELPLTVMDTTLGNIEYRGLSAEEAWQKIETLLTVVKRYSGCVVLLFHNSYMDVIDHADYMNIYKQCLEWVSNNNGIGMSTEQVIKQCHFRGLSNNEYH